jgi:hypothetical protein
MRNQVELYRGQVRDYLDATGAPEGLLVFVTTGQLVHVRPGIPTCGRRRLAKLGNLGCKGPA